MYPWKPEIVRGFHKVKIIFIRILKCYLPFSPSFFHKSTVEFPRPQMTCDDVALMTNWTWYSCFRVPVLILIWKIALDITHMNKSFSVSPTFIKNVKGSWDQNVWELLCWSVSLTEAGLRRKNTNSGRQDFKFWMWIKEFNFKYLF